MDSEQVDMAAAFGVDKLLDLRVLLSANKTMWIILNAPLLIVPKEGQEGECWWVIMDMSRGDQNSCMGSDPLFLPWSSHILDQMQGGYSVLVDVSKLFYPFLTHPNKRPYLGLNHLVTGIFYV
jgi:hypothetical protein